MTRPSTAMTKSACGDVTLPESRLVELLDKLRASVVDDMETRAAARKVKIQTLTDERLTSYTEELEERLRTHWPRKGRSEVSFRQPREGELIAHRQRKERHLRLCYSATACIARTSSTLYHHHTRRSRPSRPTYKH